MKIPHLVLLATALLVVMLAGCGTSSDTVNTVDDAVKLLQDIERRGTWITIEDGLSALDDRGDYRATLVLQNGDLVPGEQTITEPDHTLTIQVTVDAKNYTRYTFTESGREPQQWIGIPAANAAPGIYREQDGVFTCAPDDMRALLREGLPGILDSQAAAVTGIKTLSIIEEDGKITRLDRDAAHFTLETRLDEALAILEQTGNETLRQQIEQVGTFTLTGTLDRDDATGALLHFESVYRDMSRDTWASMIFEVTQWDDVPTISAPDTLPVCD